MIENKKIGIIGCGNMGTAIFSGLAGKVEKSTSLMVSELDTARREAIQERHKIIVEIDNNYVVKYCDVIILAVKPRDLEGVLRQEVCCGVSSGKLVISIAAGVTTKFIETIVGRDIPVVRAMPNMPALVGKAVTAIAAGSAAGKAEMELAGEIFRTIGGVVEVAEPMMDAVTAISGSGPAYFFLLVEALAEAGVRLGLDRKTADSLAGQTAIGSAALLEATGRPPADLRKAVASKGGTTEAALKVFGDKGLMMIVAEAAEAAAKRSKELSKG